MSDPASGKGPSLQAEEVFASFVLSRERGERGGLDELCARHPELAAELRKLHADWSLLETVCLRELGEGSLVSTMLLRGAPAAEGAPSPEARAVFTEYLLAREEGTAPTVAQMCKEHPELAGELRDLSGRWQTFEKAFEAAGGAGSLTKTLLIRHGRDALEDAQWESARPDDLVKRLLETRGKSGHHYGVCGEVARGGMGAILKVWDPNLRRNLAMKVIHEGHRQVDVRESTSAVDRVLSRFLEEAQVTGQLDHPGIVPVYELGIDDKGRCYFTMRLVRGRDLARIYELVWAEREGWSTTRALNVLLNVCDAMSYAHSKRVLHRDLKPANVMVGRFGETYVMDWGLARVLGKREVHDVRPAPGPELSIVQTDRKASSDSGAPDDLRTMDGDVIGTPAYMAPEQARGSLEEIGTHTDVYAIGAMLYHLLARHPPYLEPGQRRTASQVLQLVLAGPPRALDEATPRPPAELVAICEKAMARDVGARYASVGQLAEDLRAFLEGRVVQAYETGPLAELRKWVKRNRIAAGSVLSGIALVLLFLFARNRSLAEDNQVLVGDVKQAVDDKERAVAEKTLVEQQRDEIERQKQRVLRLADAKRLEQLTARADELWPAVPRLVPALTAWLEPAAELAGRLDVHRKELRALRGEALARTPEQLAADRASHPRAEELRRLEDERAALDAGIAQLEAGERTVQGENELVERRAERAKLSARIDELAAEISAFRRWEFEEPELQWHHDLLSEFILVLARFADPETGLVRSVRDRIELARTIEAESTGRHAEAWERAVRSIADEKECPAYRGLLLRPQVGLVPLARNPDTKLWEFAHVATGSVPAVDAGGRWSLGEGDGMVFVLLPGGTARVGAEVPDRDRLIASDPNAYDSAYTDEGPIHEVELAPFFIGKHEVTQGQWLRATGERPSAYGPLRKASGLSRTEKNPVESVTWLEADLALRRLGLALPTEVQWEHAARAGTGTPWWTGARASTLDGKANLADEFARANFGPEEWRYERRLTDGFVVHAPVDALAPNAFGLFNVAGNVSEWCRDGYAPYAAYPPAPRTGERSVPAPEKRVARGGSFKDDADRLRSAYRHRHVPGDRQNFLGVRAVRDVER